MPLRSVVLSVVLVTLGGAAGPAAVSFAARGDAVAAQAVYLSDIAVGAHTLDVCLNQDAEDSAPRAVASWTLRQARGTHPPRTTARPVATLRGTQTCHRVRRLQLNTAYTFLGIAYGRRGQELGRSVDTASARVPGMFVAAGSPASRLLKVVGDSVMVQAHRASARIEAALSRSNGLFGAVRSAAGNWSRPERIFDRYPGGAPADRYYPGGSPFLAGDDRGDVVVGWNAATTTAQTSGWFVRRPAAGGWGAVSALERPGGGPASFAYLRALALDNAAHMHVLVTGDLAGLHYDTDATGQWTETAAPVCDLGGTGCDVLMTYDRVRDRIVVVSHTVRQHSGKTQNVVAVADAPAASDTIGPPQVVSVTPIAGCELMPTSVTSVDGQTTIGLGCFVPSMEILAASTRAARPALHQGWYVMAGSSPASIGGLTRVPGTDKRDVPDFESSPLTNSLWVSGTSPNRTIIAFGRRRAWDPRLQGIWTLERIRDARTGAWHFGVARHISNTPYDTLDSLSLGRHGLPVVGFHRT